jgi:hypothetical protein
LDRKAFQNVGGILDEPANDYDLHNAEKALPARGRKSIEDNRSAGMIRTGETRKAS